MQFYCDLHNAKKGNMEQGYTFFNSRKLDCTLILIHNLQKRLHIILGYILNMTMQFILIKSTNSSGKKYHFIAFYI